MSYFYKGYLPTLQDIFMWIIIMGIEIMGERKYGNFFSEIPKFRTPN